MPHYTSVYNCEVCGISCDPTQKGVLRLAYVWMRGSGNSVAKVEERFHRYRHEVCEPYAKDQLSLF